MTDREATKERAWQDFTNRPNRPILRQSMQSFDAGFDAGAEWARGEAWVPVSERLPDEPNPWPVDVLLTVQVGDEPRYRFVVVGKYEKGEWMNANGKNLEDDLLKVLAWMLLKKPYTPEAK